MPRYAVFHNANPDTRKAYPYLLDIQHGLHEALATKLVVPLAPMASAKSHLIKELNPRLRVRGAEYAAMIQQMAAIRVSDLGSLVGNCDSEGQAIRDAIGLLLYGF